MVRTSRRFSTQGTPDIRVIRPWKPSGFTHSPTDSSDLSDLSDLSDYPLILAATAFSMANIIYLQNSLLHLWKY